MRLHRKTSAAVVFLQLRLFILHAAFFGYDKVQHVPGSHCSFKHFRFIRVRARRQAARIHNYKLIQSSLFSLPWLIHTGDDCTATQKCDTQRQCAPSPMYLCVCVCVCERERGWEIRAKEPDLIKAIVLIYEVWPQMIHLIRWCHMRDRHVTGLAMCATLYVQDNMKLQILSSSCQDVIPIIPNLYDFDRIF